MRDVVEFIEWLKTTLKYRKHGFTLQEVENIGSDQFMYKFHQEKNRRVVNVSDVPKPLQSSIGITIEINQDDESEPV